MSNAPTSALPDWGRRLVRFYPVFAVALVTLGLLSGYLIDTVGYRASDLVAGPVLFVLIPSFLLADAILNARFLPCALRILPLPVLPYGAVGLASDTGEATSTLAAIGLQLGVVFAIASLMVVVVTRALRGSRA